MNQDNELVPIDNSTQSISEFSHKWKAFFLAAAAFVLVVMEVVGAVRRPFWFDELGTLTVSSVPTLKEMFRAIPVDGNPPLYFLLARLSLHLPIPVEIALRVPSIVAINVTAWMIYLFVRRGSSSVFGLLSMCIFLGSPYGHFATLEARPYALLLCFTSIALVCWQSATLGERRRLALAGIAACMAGAIFTHQYGVIYVSVPLLAGECVRTWRRRRIDFPVLVTIIVGATTIAITFPPVLREQAELLSAIKLDPAFAARPSLRFLFGYLDTFPDILPILVVIAGAIGGYLRYVVLARKGTSERLTQPASRVRPEYLAAGFALVLLLPIMLLVTELGTRYFAERYAIGSALGVAVVAGLFSSHLSRRFPAINTFIPAVILYSFAMALIAFCHGGQPRDVSGVQAEPVFLSAPAAEPVVIDDPLVFFATWHYGDSGMRSHIHYLIDLNYAAKQPEFVGEYALWLEQPYGSPKVDIYKDFLASHRKFLLYTIGMPKVEWVERRLTKEGWHLTPITSANGNTLYRVEQP